jgi:hypothetical protein
MQTLGRMIDDLKQEAEFDSTGRFSLDRRRAREKMRKFQLVEPHYYVLELIQAAVAGGATFIDIYQDADDFIITFDGRHYTREDLENLYSSLFVSQKDLSLERFRELAIGINSAQALGPSFIRVSSGDYSGTVELLIRPGQEDAFVVAEEAVRGTRIHVREKVSWKVASRFLSRYVASKIPSEEKLVRERCLFSPVPVKINGVLVNPPEGMTLPDSFCQVSFETEGFRGILGIPRGHRELSSIQLAKWGVVINQRYLKLSFIPLLGVVHGDGLLKNVSQSDFVENDDYRKCLEAIKASVDGVLAGMVDSYAALPPNASFYERIQARDYILGVIDARFRALAYDENSPLLMQKLAGVELFETTDRKMVSLGFLVEQMKKLGYLPYSRKYFNQRHPDDMDVAYVEDEPHLNMLNKIFSSRTRNVEQDFYQVYIRQRNLKEWSLRKGRKAGFPFSPLVSRGFQSGPVSGEISLASRAPDRCSRAVFSREKGSIATKALEVDGLFFDAVVDSDSLNPVYTYDDLERDASFTNAVKALLEHLPAAYLELARIWQAASPEDQPDPIIRVHLLRYMNFVLGGESPQDQAAPPGLEGNGTGQGEPPRAGDPPEKPRRLVGIIDLAPGVEDHRMGKKAEAVEIEGLDLKLPGVFRELKLFLTIDRMLVSLNDLQGDLEKYKAISYVKREISGPQADTRHVVAAFDVEEDVLKKYFGWYKLVNYERAILEEKEARQFMDRPVEEPVIAAGCVFKVPVDEEGVTGEIGLLSGPQAPAGPRPAARLRLLKRRRFIVEKPAPMFLPVVCAVINFDGLSVNPSWTEVMEDDTWNNVRMVMDRAVMKLAEKCLEGLGTLGPSRPRALEFLKEYSPSLVGRYEYRKEDAPPGSLTERLMELPLFPALDDSLVSLSGIQKEKEAFGSVAYVNAGFTFEAPLERAVLSLSPGDLEILQKIFGFRYLENVQDKLKQVQISLLVKKSRPREEPVISEKEVICLLSFEEGGVSGQAGLCRRGFSPGHGMSSLKILKEKIPVVTKLVSLGVQLQASVNFDGLDVSTQWNDVQENKKYDTLKKAVKAQIEPLMEILLQAWESLGEEERREAGRHVLSYLTSTFSRYGDVLKAKPGSLPHRAASVPLFAALGGKSLNFMDVAGQYGQNNKILFVPAWTQDRPLEDSRLVPVIDAEAMQLLKRIFLYFTDYTEILAREKIARQNLEKKKLESLEIKEGYLVKLPVGRKGLSGELAIPDSLRPGQGITFALKMVPVVEKPLYQSLPVFGFVNSDEFAFNDTVSDVILYAREKRELLDVVYRLFGRLADELPAMAEGEKKELARQFMLGFYYDQAHLIDTEFRVMDQPLERKIAALPLLPISDGRYVAIDVLMSTLERLGCVPFVRKGEIVEIPGEDVVFLMEPGDSYHRFCLRAAGADRLKSYHLIVEKRRLEEEKLRAGKRDEEQKREREALLQKKARQKDVEKARAKKARAKAGQPAGAAVQAGEVDSQAGEEPPAAGQDAGPEERLLFAMKKELRIMRERGDYKLSEKILKNMTVSFVEGKPAVIFNRKHETVIINVLHPVVRRILEGLPKDTRPVYYLLSIFYSTINRELLEITDDDEVRFQQVMIENLLARPGGPVV